MEENYILAYDNTTGDILGFYLRSIHGENIPTPNIEITAEKHNFYMEHNGRYRLNPETLEDELIPVQDPEPQPYEPTLAEKNRADIDYLSIMLGVEL